MGIKEVINQPDRVEQWNKMVATGTTQLQTILAELKLTATSTVALINEDLPFIIVDIVVDGDINSIHLVNDENKDLWLYDYELWSWVIPNSKE